MKWGADEFTGKRFGKYEVLCRLAVGGMAEIFLGFARHGPFTGRSVVLKRILAEQREEPEALQMLIDEAKLTATLSHPNCAQVYDLEVAGDEVVLVIEFIRGCNLEELVELLTQGKETLPLGFALGVIREAAQGLGHAHTHRDDKGKPQPIVHRDVTPRNIMVDFEGTTKMLDFGIARAMGAQRRTVAGMVRGTTAYMSPEQAVGKDLDPRTDLFSLGVIFHELLTGQRLFARANPALEMAAVYEADIPLPSKVNRRVAKSLDPLAMRLLERARDKRYQSAADFVRDLAQAAGNTAWPHERCAEVVKERFSERLSDVTALVAMIPPLHVLIAATEPGRANAPPYPEGRTLISNLKLPEFKPPPAHVGDEEIGNAKTMVSAGPVPRRPAPAVALESVTDPGQHTLDEQRRRAGLRAEHLFSDLEAPVEHTRIIPGGGAPRPLERPTNPDNTSPPERTQPERSQPERSQPERSQPERSQPERSKPERSSQPRMSEADTDPRRPPVRRAKPSSAPLVLAAIAALFLGAVGGAFIYKRFGASRATPSVGRLTILSDRPAMVVLGGLPLGKTPLENLIVPAGRLALELHEEAGAHRALDIEVQAAQETRVSVTLDTLRKLP